MAALFLSGAMRRRIDRIPALRRTRWLMEAALLKAFWQVCSRLAPDRASAFGRVALRALGPSLGKNAHIRRNLLLAFPDLPDDKRAALEGEVWGTAGAVLGEYPHFKAICHDHFERHFETVLNCDLSDYQTGRRCGIFVTAHVGNWELSAAAAVSHGIPITVIYAPSQNPVIDRMLRRRREALGCGLVSLGEGARPLMRELGEGRSIGLVVDARDDDGIPVPFFGLDKMTTLAPARLALRFDCDLVPARVERLGDARFRLIVHEPIRPDPTLPSDKDRAVQMMCDLNRLFEQWIRAQPAQWLCIKRAWAKDLDPARASRAAGVDGVTRSEAAAS